MSDRSSSESVSLDAIADNVENGNGALASYPGGKNGAGVWQRLINLMPPHRCYIEAFLGSGAILRRKRPAPGDNIGIDLDRAAIDAFAGRIAGRGDGGHGHAAPEVQLHCCDAVDWLRARRWRGNELVYCDPPYLGAVRSQPNRLIYAHEMPGERKYAELLGILATIPAMVMISGYASRLYDITLRDWNRVEFQAMTRGGVATEVVWFNFPRPTRLHDYRFLGKDFADRCRIARKIKRWTNRLAAMEPLERAAVLAAFDAARCSSGLT